MKWFTRLLKNKITEDKFSFSDIRVFSAWVPMYPILSVLLVLDKNSITIYTE